MQIVAARRLWLALLLVRPLSPPARGESGSESEAFVPDLSMRFAVDQAANPLGLTWSHGLVARFSGGNNGMSEVAAPNTTSATGAVMVNGGTVWKIVYI